MDIRGLVESLVEAGAFDRIVNNPLAQFGTDQRRYLGAELLPERLVPENSFTEEGIEYRTIVANDATRYSPVQIKEGVLVGSFHVVLGDSDIGSELKANAYDAILRLIERSTGTQGVVGGGVDRPTMQAVAQLTRWTDFSLTRPLIENAEVQKWQAIVNAQVTRRGDNGYTEIVKYPNPTGHRVSAGGTWSSNTYDPYADIMAAAEFMRKIGYTLARIITGTDVLSILAMNAKIQARFGRINVQGGNVVNQPIGRVTTSELSAGLASDALPAIEPYDLQYRTNTGSGYFLPRGTMVLIANTGRDEAIDRGDLEPIVVGNTLGYHAIGRAAGQSAPGRVTNIQPFATKPPRIEGQAWQTHLPVPTSPEAIFVIKDIA